MRKKVVSVFGVLLLIAMMAIPSAYAAPGNYRGYELNNAGPTGLRALMSTGVTPYGSPPSFYFPAKSPDVHQQFSQELKPRNACLAVEVRHDHVAGSGTTQNRLYFVGVCDGTSGYVDLNTDATFRSKYVRINTWNDTGEAFQDETLDVRVWYNGSSWQADVYNYNTSTYDVFRFKTGSRNEVGYVDFADQGYTQDPTMSCPTLYPWGILQIRGIQKYVSGTWSAITTGDITAYANDPWPCITANQYMVASPQVYQLKLKPFGTGY